MKPTVKIGGILLIGVALFVLSGCASTSEIDSIKATVSNLQFQSITQNNEIASLKARLQEQERELSRLKERLEGIYALRESQTNLLTQTHDFSKELQTLKGRFDENKYFMDKTLKELSAERELQQAKITALEKELNELKQRLTLEQKKPPQEQAKPETEKADDTDSAELKAQNLYDDAQIEFKERKYATARQKFEKFIKDNPEHKLVPNAQFWIGEAYFNEKKFEEAILAYETFIKKYPKHERVKVAMLRQGYAFLELGDKKTGKVILERLIERFPRTSEADLAEKKIAELLSQGRRPTQKRR